MLRAWASRFAAALLLVSVPAAHAQLAKDTAALKAATARQVEQALTALRPAVQVEGRTYEPETLATMMQRLNVPGLSMAVLRDGRVAWAGAFGMADAGTRRAATVNTLFQAASVSKPVAATAALKLAQLGRLDLDAPVNAKLKSWRIPDSDVARGQSVTLRHLLTHTAGLSGHGFGGYRPGTPVPTLTQVLDGAEPANSDPVRVNLLPGSEWRYSGGGFTVAQQLLTDVDGRSFPALMHDLVLKPAGMTNSTFQQPLPSSRATAAARGHLGTGKPIPGGYHIYPEMAAAGLWTTPTDLARWAATLSAAYNGKGGGMLSPKMARAMLTPGKGDWGLGLGVRKEGESFRFSHSGANEGFRSLMIVDAASGDGFVIMANGDNGSTLFSAIVQAFGGVFGWPEAKPRLLVPVALGDADRDSIMGRYELGAIMVDVALKDGRIFATQNESQTFELIPVRKDVFASPDIGLRIEFVRDEKTGQVTALRSGGATLQRKP